MIKFSKQVIKRMFNLFGMEITKVSRAPMHTLLGLKNERIQTIIDIGANEGQFAKSILKMFPHARVLCFEPSPGPYKKLREWSTRQSDRVSTFNVALGDTERTVEMYNHMNHSPSSSLLQTTETCEKLYPFTKQQNVISVQLTTLDKAATTFTDYLIPDILIKLDVQGFEDRVIRGGIETFRKAKACILEICLDELYEHQANFKDIVLMLSNLGFQYTGNLEQSYADNGHVVFIDAVFSK